MWDRLETEKLSTNVVSVLFLFFHLVEADLLSVEHCVHKHFITKRHKLL